MTTNFRVSVHRNSENLHVKLMGDFDEISARQLLDILRRYSHGTSRAFIHTSCLGEIHPFGLSLFHNQLKLLKGKSLELVFTGDHASRLAPERPPVFDLTILTVPPVSSPERNVLSPSPVKPE
jgi:hypothetical protein